MRAWPLLLLFVGSAEAGPLPALPSLRTMSKRAAKDREPLAPQCFAYSRKHHAFACVGHDSIYNVDHVGAADQATNVRIDAIGPRTSTSWTVAAIGGRKTVRRAEVVAQLRALEMRPLATCPVKLAPNAWVRIGGEQLRLGIALHEGDASIEYFGDLRLRCAAGTEIVFDLRAEDFELGETAWAFRSPDGAWLAVSVVGVDGGEETFVYTIDTAVIDVAASCATRAAVWTTTSQP
ncbi:MAG: hypothetical protein ACTHU0_17985 [Kofleriaceae bacterium]